MTHAEFTLKQAHRLSVAPMLDWTNRDFRYFLRLISKHCLLYTEMVTTGALIHGDRERFLGHDISEYLWHYSWVVLILRIWRSVPGLAKMQVIVKLI